VHRKAAAKFVRSLDKRIYLI